MSRFPESRDGSRTLSPLSVVALVVLSLLWLARLSGMSLLDRLSDRYYQMGKAALAARAPDDPHLSQQVETREPLRYRVFGPQERTRAGRYALPDCAHRGRHLQ